MRLQARLYADLLDKPYEFRARGPEKYDCVGLLLEVYRRMGRELPHITSYVGSFARHASAWKQVETPEPGDVILMRGDRPRLHVGIAVSECEMLHSHENRGTVVERFDSAMWKMRVLGFYRWRAA